MNKETMKQLIIEDISKKLGTGFYISIQEVLKTNIKRDALIILKNGDNVSPNIYLEPYYDKFLHHVPISSISDEILEIYDKAHKENSNLDVSFLKNIENVIPRLFVKIINKHMNQELLKNIPYKCFLDDFAIVPYCCMHIAEEGIASFLINNMHMESWAIDKDSLITLAIANTRALFGVELQSMSEVLFGRRTMEEVNLPFPEAFNPPMFVLTNKPKMNGASVALFDDVLKEFAKVHGNFYVIFSSVHEALLIPDDYKLDLENLTSINLEVNETSVDCDEVLGTKAYFYDEEKGFVIK